VVGCLVILRRMAFLGDALSHAMIAGVAGGYLFMKVLFGVEAHAPAMLIGSVLAAVLTVALIGFVSNVSRVKEDSAIGIMYCGVFAGGVVLVSVFRHYIHIDLMHFIMGDVLGVADVDLWIAVLVAAFVLSAILLFFRHFQLASFDPVMAASIGMPVALISYALTTCVSLVVVSAVSMVGVILVVGLLITPAATAYLLSDRLNRMMILAGLFGVTSVVGGLYLCVWLDSAGGGAIMLFCTLQFLVVLIVAPRYGLLAGWLRRARMVPQELIEDILGSILRAGAGKSTLETLAAYVVVPRRRLGRAVASLSSEGLLRNEGGRLDLTDKGHAEAQRVRRAHRLWETYLEHVGAPVADLHSRAHQLEHMHDPATVEYLDHELGHPVTDPHGAQIAVPCIEPGQEVHLTQLPPGQLAEIVSFGPGAAGRGLEAGQVVELRPRHRQDDPWIVAAAGGGEIRLDHAVADNLNVRVL
jgi:manganese/iron transport system permease protein/iron/zinc/copper transport system permease protein